MLWLLWIMLQWTLVCRYFFRTAISVPLILFILFVWGVFWFFSWLHCAAYGILVAWPGIELWSTAGKAPSLNHWITRKFTSLFPLSLISFEHMFSRRFANTLVTWCKQFTHWKRPRCWGRLRGGGEGGDRGRDGWIVMPMTQWIWPWANPGRQRGTGRPGVLQSMGLQSRTRLIDWTTRESLLDHTIVFFNFLRALHAVFHKSWTSLHYHKKNTEFSHGILGCFTVKDPTDQGGFLLFISHVRKFKAFKGRGMMWVVKPHTWLMSREAGMENPRLLVPKILLFPAFRVLPCE